MSAPKKGGASPATTTPPPSEMPLRDMMMPDAWYDTLDAGIRFPVRVLHATGGIETCQSCEGGEGHAYDRPSIDLIAAGGDDAAGFAALAALTTYAIDVFDVALLWTCHRGLPLERIWRVTLRRAYPERASDLPGFIASYRATPRGAVAS